MARPPTRLSGAFTRAEIQRRYRIRQAANKQQRHAAQTLAALAAGEVPEPAHSRPPPLFQDVVLAREDKVRPAPSPIVVPIAPSPAPANFPVTGKFRTGQIAPPPSALSKMIGAPLVPAPAPTGSPWSRPAPPAKEAASITTSDPPSRYGGFSSEPFDLAPEFVTPSHDTADETDNRLNQHEFKQFAGPNYNEIVAVLTYAASGINTRYDIAAACGASPMAVLKIVGWLEHQNLVTVDATGHISRMPDAIDKFRNRLDQ